MPMYTWHATCCDETVQIVRAVKDIETPPAADECQCRCTNQNWERLMCAATFRLLGSGFHVNDYHKFGPRG